MRNGKTINLIALILLVALTALILLKSDITSFSLQPDHISQFVEGFGIWGPIMLMGLVVLEVVFAPIPGAPLYVIGGILFGAILGGLIVLVGNIIGAIICFLLARSIGLPLIERFVNRERLAKINQVMEDHGGLFIFLIRLNPFTSSDLFSYAAGLTRMKLWPFIAATTLGLIPYAFLPSLFGAYLNYIDPRVIWILFGLISAGVIFYITRFIRKKPGRSGKKA